MDTQIYQHLLEQLPLSSVPQKASLRRELDGRPPYYSLRADSRTTLRGATA